MLRRSVITAGLFISVSAIVSTQSWAQSPKAQPWTTRALGNNPQTFQFAILCDRTGGTRVGVFEKAIERINLLQPDLVLSIGDLIEGNGTSETELNSQWDEFDRILSRLQARFFFTPGNHDVSKTPLNAAIWRKRHGPLFYHFLYRDTLFLCLNTDDGQVSQIGEEQILYMQTTLKKRSKVRWTFVFMHKPLWIFEKAKGWDSIEALLAGRPHTVFAGHTHEYKRYQRNGQDYFVFSTTGGSWSKTRKPNEFDQIGWVSMTPPKPQVAILKLDCLADPSEIP